MRLGVYRSMRAGAGRAMRMAAVLAGAALGGCSYSYVDDAGNRRIIGFVDMTVAQAPADSPAAGSVVDVTTVGLSIARHGQGGHLAMGYTRDTVAVLRNDALVVGNPLAAGRRDDTKGDSGE